MSITLYVAATQVRDGVTGLPIAPAAGSVPTADGSGGATWVIGGSSVTLNPTLTGNSLIIDGVGPSLALKDLIAGPGIGFTSTATDLQINNTSPATSVTLNPTLTGNSLVNDGIGPSLAVKDLIAGAGIGLTTTATDIQINNTSAATSVTLANGGGGGSASLVSGGTGPALSIKGLTAAVNSGILLTSSPTEIAISVDNADLPFLPTAGGAMTGGIDMGGNPLTQTENITPIASGAQYLGSIPLPYADLYLANNGGTGTKVGLTKYRQWLLVSTNNSIALTTLMAPSGDGSRVIPANTLAPGVAYTVNFAGELENIIAGAGTTWQLRIGPTIAISVVLGVIPGAAALWNYNLEFVFMCSSVGATGACVCSARFRAAGPSGDIGYLLDAASPATINTAIANSIDVFSQNVIVHPNQRIAARYLYITRL